MGYKVTIVLIWLALPLAALLLLRADFERYQRELREQLSYADQRKDMLTRYSLAYDNRGREILGITDPQSRILWEQSFRAIEQQRQAEEAQVGNPGLSHYPQTRDMMKQAEDELGQQRDNLRDAARLQDAYAKSEGNLDQLRSQAMEFYWRADQARAFGWVEQYYVFQDALARVEGEIQRRDQQRFELNQSLTLSLSQANAHRNELHRLLGSLPDQLALDQGRTYRQDLTQRFASFDLRGLMKHLVLGDTAQAAQSH